jgi:hypothetical protein
MADSLKHAHRSAPRVIPEMHPEMLSANLRKPETDGFAREIGRCLDFARRANGWTLDELATKLPAPENAEKRDPRQVQRWIDGKERCQLDVVFAVQQLRGPFVIALAQLAECEVVTTISVKRSA